MVGENQRATEKLWVGNGVEIKSWHPSDSDFLIFHFQDHFSTTAAEKACEIWTDFHEKNASSLIHIWDCTSMKSFDMAAKNVWMGKMKDHKDYIERIILISDSIFIRGAARLMSKFSKHPLAVYKSIEEVGEKENLQIPVY